MWWFNLLAGLASIASLLLSLLALRFAGEAKRRVTAFERHEEAVRLISPLTSAKLAVNELRTSHSPTLVKARCVTLADDLSQLVAAPAGPPTPDLRVRLEEHLDRLRLPKVARSADTERWLGEIATHLAMVEVELRSASRQELKR